MANSCENHFSEKPHGHGWTGIPPSNIGYFFDNPPEAKNMGEALQIIFGPGTLKIRSQFPLHHGLHVVDAGPGDDLQQSKRPLI